MGIIKNIRAYFKFPKFKLVNLNKYGIYNIENQGVYDTTKNIIIEKGKYILTKRQDIQYDIVMDFDNSVVTYNHIWDSSDFMDIYLHEGRIRFFKSICGEILGLINLNSAIDIIDVGVGPGVFIKLLFDILSEKKCNFSITGIDNSNSSIKKCQELIPTGYFKLDDIFNISYGDEKFDLVICTEVLEHIQFVKKAIDELYRICRPNGHVIITVPNGKYDSWIGHINFWSEGEFKELLKGFNLIKFMYLEDQKGMMFIIKK